MVHHRLVDLVSATIRPSVTTAVREAGDPRFGADQLAAAARDAVAAWVLAVAGDDAALAAMASPDVAHWLLHPGRKKWQVAAGPTVTEIDVWRLDSDADPPRLRFSVRFTGRQAFDDLAAGDMACPGATETEFVGLFQLALADTAGWRLVSGHVQTLDDYYGYVFTSRHETADEYLARTGSALPAEAAGPPRIFRITAGFAEHDVRFGASASIQVQRSNPPGRDEAGKLVWPAVEDVTTKALGVGDWQPSLNWLDVIELWADVADVADAADAD